MLGSLAGTVVEIGPGTGANLRYLPGRVRWIGIEPNAAMHAVLFERARASGIAAELRLAAAQRLEFADASVDVVLSTLVLCTVPDPATTLAEARRVLRPKGRFVFLEHVVAPRGSRLRALQRVLRPLWQLAGDGCHPDRDLATHIRNAGFASVEMEEFHVRRHSVLDLVSPHIAGVAWK